MYCFTMDSGSGGGGGGALRRGRRPRCARDALAPGPGGEKRNEKRETKPETCFKRNMSETKRIEEFEVEKCSKNFRIFGSFGNLEK